MTTGQKDVSAIPFGLQLFSIRHALKSDDGRNFATLAAAIAKMGYDGVEFGGYYPAGADEMARILADNGLACFGTHTGIEKLLGDELEKTVDFHRTLDCRMIVVPVLAEAYRESFDTWKRTAELFNEIAERLRPYDMRVGYHNHSMEFEAIGGQVPLEVFLANTTPDVIMQIDVGNAMGGGGDPAALIEKYPGRYASVHLKEHGGPKGCLIGEGEVDWRKILPLSAEVGGAEVFIVEHEKNPDTAIADVEACLRYLKGVIG